MDLEVKQRQTNKQLNRPTEDWPIVEQQKTVRRPYGD